MRDSGAVFDSNHVSVKFTLISADVLSVATLVPSTMLASIDTQELMATLRLVFSTTPLPVQSSALGLRASPPAVLCGLSATCPVL